MANIMGKDGSFHLGDVLVGSIDNWTINRTGGTAEVTSFGESLESHDATIKSWTASIAGTLNSTDASQLSIRDQLENASLANISCEFLLGASSSSKLFTGTGIVESDTMSSPVKDKVAWSCNIRGDGELSWTA